MRPRKTSNGRFDAVFIDFYGTLVTGDRRAVEATCARVVDENAMRLSAAELAEAWGRRFFQAIETCNRERFETLFDCECRTLCETVEPHIGVIDPVPYARMLKHYWSAPEPADGALQALQVIDVPVCIVSNADTEDIHKAVGRCGLEVDCIVTSEDARSYKPDEDIFRRALEEVGVRRDRVIHVGDSIHSDVCGAQKLGIATCWVCYSDRILDVGEGTPDHTVHSLLDLPELL